MASNDQQPAYRTTVVPLSRSGVDLIITFIIVPTVATFWTGLRIYSRRLRGLRIQPEDYTVLVALVMLYCAVVCSILMVVIGGMGHHIRELQASHVEILEQLSFGVQISYALCLGLVKCSICQMLARIFFLTPYRVGAYIAMGLAISWSLTTILIGFLICRPIIALWDPTTQGSHCGVQSAAFASAGIVDVITDGIILLLPIPMVWQLQIPRVNKIGVACIFGLGIITIIVGAFRVETILHVDFTDAAYSIQIPSLLTIIEMGVAIMVSGGPIMRPLFDWVFHRIASIANSALEGYGNDICKDHTAIMPSSVFRTMRPSANEMAFRDLEGLSTPMTGERIAAHNQDISILETRVRESTGDRTARHAV